jgi:methyl-accepting chemotaxis protein
LPSLRLKLSHRLSGGFGLILLLLAATITLALVQMQGMRGQMRDMVETNNERVAAAHAMLDAVNEISVSSLGFAMATDASDVAAQKEEVDQRIASYEEAQKRFEEFAAKDAASALADEQKKALRSFVSETRNSTEAIVQASKGGASAAAAITSLDPRGLQQQWLKAIQGIVAHERELAKTAYEQAGKSFERTRAVLLTITGAALLIGGFAAWLILRSVTRPINRAIEHAKRISTGDLSGHIVHDGNDEMAALLRVLADMQLSLRRMIEQVRGASTQIQGASDDISAGGRDLSARTEQTAANLQETAASMQQLASLVDRGAQAGKEARDGVGNAAAVAAKGGAVMGQVVKTMEDIDQSSRRIAQIVGVIDGIAFQTNILALNAAVEAARAGEQGRGFAVVASEVRSLAGRSAEAAREIKSLINSSVERVAAGTDLVQQAGATMTEIVNAVQSVTHKIQDIATTLDAQRQGMGEVSAAVSQVDQMTQQNAALAEQSSAAAETLGHQTVLLSGVVDEFKT